MMHLFLSSHQEQLVEICREKARSRPGRGASEAQLEFGIPLFLSQLIHTLRSEKDLPVHERFDVSGPSGGVGSALFEMGSSAAHHGAELLRLGYTVEQVVHDYGDICQAATSLAVELGAQFGVEEFRTLNRCLDNAIADAVSEFSRQRDEQRADEQGAVDAQRMGSWAHELRNHLGTASLAFAALKASKLGVEGSTGAILDRSLRGLGQLIIKELSTARDAGSATQPPFAPGGDWHHSLASLIAEAAGRASLEAKNRGCRLSVGPVDPSLRIQVDSALVLGALQNLLQNAFKFTLPGTEVVLAATSSGGRAIVSVSDHCGGLAPGVAESMFAPFSQSAFDKSGLGLGLGIARRDAEQCGGHLSVKNHPGCGCEFILDLPLAIKAS